MKPWILSGAGNTFLIEILKREDPPSSPQIQSLCQKYKTDGFLRLVPGTDRQFFWHFYNRDGSSAEFCGNAARCAQFYIEQSGYKGKIEQISPSAAIQTWTEGKQNWVSLPHPKILDINKKLKITEGEFSGFWCVTGVPHFVINETKKTSQQLKKIISSQLRHHQGLGPAGANITWVKDADPVEAVTFERGVEDFTEACGSGAFAVSLKLSFENPQKHLFNIHMPGGVLETKTQDGEWIMTGPVEKLGEWPGSEK